MNILIDLLPSSVEIEGVEYKINSDFRTSILFELLMNDNELSDNQKAISSLRLYYPLIPKNLNLAIDKILWVYSCGKNEEDRSSKGNNKKSSEVIYDFDYDDDYIYSAFLSQYNIDLQDIKFLHWWKFKAMFKSLKEDNKIVEIMSYRSLDLSSIKDKEEKARYKKLKDVYKIPNNISKTEKEKLYEIEEILKNGGDISKALTEM